MNRLNGPTSPKVKAFLNALERIENQYQEIGNQLCEAIDAGSNINQIKLPGLLATPDVLHHLERLGRKEITPMQFLEWYTSTLVPDS